MALERLHDLGHRELSDHDFALINPVRVPEDRWQDLPVMPLQAPAFKAQPHLVPRLLPLAVLEDGRHLELLERNDRQCVETGSPLFCALIESRTDIRSLATGLGGRMLLDTPTGKTVWLRFHDPRVFSALAWWLDPVQLRQLLGPVVAWTWFDPRDGRWNRIGRPGHDGHGSGRLRLTPAQWDRLQRQPAVNRCLKILAGGTAAGPLRLLVERLDRYLAEAGDAGLNGLDEAGLRQWMRESAGHMEEHA